MAQNNFKIQKLISQAGIASRRNAEKLILENKVLVNGKIAKLGDRASFKDEIIVNGQKILKQEKVYYIMNKPIKTITSVKDDRDRQTVIDLISEEDYIFPVGRLDYNTTGLLLLTNDGELANKLMHPSSEIVRKYKVRIDEKLSNKELAFLNSDSVIIDNKPSSQIVNHVDRKSYEVILKEGRNHHVKKIFGVVQKKVLNLHRFEYAGLLLANLPKGKYRSLNSKELRWLKSKINLKK